MSDQMPGSFVFNGVNASEKSPRRGRYLLELTADELQQAALGQVYGKRHFQELKARNLQQEEQRFALEFGRDENNLAEFGWGVIFPTRADNQPVLQIREALSELLDWRKHQAGNLYQEYNGPRGYLPRDTADKFMNRYRAAPGTVDPTRLPYYLLIVGSPSEIPYRFQYELDVTYLVGRIYFDTLEEYRQYAHSVVAAEDEQARLDLPRRAVFFGTAHANDGATQLSSQMLVAPLADKIGSRLKDWQVELVPPGECRKARLASLLGAGAAPALLFTASHGVGFDNGDPMQLPFQGALLCQDLEQLSGDISRQHYLGAEDIGDDFSLHGLVCFHFACFGAGTPRTDNFIRPGRSRPKQIAPVDFLASLPRRLLSHPKGGALGVIGHVDRAWTYSFKWGQAGQQTQTFQDTLLRMMSGQRIGLALDQFNLRYAQIASRLTGMLDQAEVVRPDPTDLAGLWTANNDARGYALLGDPAALLPVARGDAKPRPRQALAQVSQPASEVGRAPGKVSPEKGEAQPGSQKPNTGEPSSETGGTPLPEGGFPQPAGSDQSGPPGGTKGQEEPTGPGGLAEDVELRSRLYQNLKGLAAQLEAFAEDLGPPPGQEDFSAEAFALNRQSLEEFGEKLRLTLQTLSERLKDFTSDIGSLDVRTYVSEQIEKEDYANGQFTGNPKQRAMTHISLDGDTQLVVPFNAGEMDRVLWEIHSQAVEQAQANRAAMLKTIGELLTGLFPIGK